MNTAKIRTSKKTLLTLLITVGLLGGATAMADQTGPSTRTENMSFSGLNLSTIEGQQIANARIHQLARTLCAQVADPTDLSHQTNYVACIDATVVKARAGLQALITKQSASQFARADVK